MSDIDTNSPTPDIVSDDNTASPEPDAGGDAAPTDAAPTDTAPTDAAPDDAAPESADATSDATADETPIVEPEILDETTDQDEEADEAPVLAPETIDDEASAADADDVEVRTQASADDVTDAEAGADASADAEGDVVSGEELVEQQAIVVDNPFTRPGRWFVVHTQSGYEKKVKQNLEARIHSMNAEEAVYEVVIPMEDYVDFKNGKRVVNQRKMFPGYLLVRAELDDTAWFVIRNTPGVTGFVGQGAKPSPLPRRDVEAFLMPKGGEEQIATRAKPRLEYELGETVRVKEGPFADFSGEVIELNEDQLKLKVLVNIFGRETPVELEFSKVAKL
jgi:transcription termination/antitermination protein NusG